MKVYEMMPMEVGEAVETNDAIVVTFKDGRIIMIMKNDIKPVTKLGLTNVDGASIQSSVTTEPKKYRHRRQKPVGRMALKYLPVIENEKLGKSLNSSIALTIYKHYGIRMWNNVVADVMSRVNSAKNDEVSLDWIKEMLKSIFESYELKFSSHQLWAYIMFLKGVGLIESRHNGFGLHSKAVYTIKRQPEIPRTIKT